MKKNIFIVVIILLVIGISAKETSLSWQKNELTSNFKLNPADPYYKEDFYLQEITDTLWHPFQSLKDFNSLFINAFSANNDNASIFIYKGNEKRKNLFFNLNFFVNFNSVFSDEDSKNYNSFAKGFLLKGKLNEKFYFYSRWVDLIYFGDTKYADRTSSYFKSWSDKNDDDEYYYIDRIRGKVLYKSDYGDFALGRGKYSIGENIKGSVILNESVNDYGYFSYNFKWKNFSLDFLHGSLIADSLSSHLPRNSYNDKFMAVHVISWENEMFKFFFGEEVIYGNRSINPNYMLPHFFMRITEHNLHNQDNCFIFAGTEVNFLQNYKYYLNINFDELSKGKLFTDWWGNKYAIQTGLSRRIDNFETTLQATAVRPWMYTHFKIENKFSHENQCLGFPEKSNLFDFAFFVKYEKSNWLFESLNSYTIQGELGNSFELNYDARPKDTARWLEGEISRKFVLKNAVSYSFFDHQSVKLGHIIQLKNDEKDFSNFSLNYQVFY